MTRPFFPPGASVPFPIKNRSGKKPLAQYLAARIGVVIPWAEELIKNGNVILDAEIATPGQLINLSSGPHFMTVNFPDTWPKHMAATDMLLEVLQEDSHLVLLDKPPGIVVHPARGHLDNKTLQNGMRRRYRHLLKSPDTTIASPHRLDKDTSGVILFTLTRDAYKKMVDQFAARIPQKEYLAVLCGDPDFDTIQVDSPIGPDPDRRGLGAVLALDKGGKAAITEFTVLERGKGWALVKAMPRTGRPHQIRVHAASLGCPLAGDADYNPHPEKLGFPRQALHASALAFPHPITGQAIRAEAPLAKDMQASLERLRTDGK